MIKKILISITLLFMWSSGYAMSDEQAYQSYLFEDNKGTYVNYYYNNNTYKIYVPETRKEFIRLDNLYLQGKLKINSYYYNVIKLNRLLEYKGLELLY